jgi:hypothetical protein
METLFVDLNSKYFEEVEKVCVENKIDASHGMLHFLAVLQNVIEALNVTELLITDREKLLVKLASLMHDIDDHKYFPENLNFENARKILTDPVVRSIDGLTDDEITKILAMIDLVSSSKHGDAIPLGTPEWYVYPRYADRLEAIGVVGVKRTYEYTVSKKGKLFTPDTQKATTEDELWDIATIKRYTEYNGKSVSMIDHFYDKLLRLGNYPIKNRFFDEECKKRTRPLIEFALIFGRKGSIDGADVDEFLERNM